MSNIRLTYFDTAMVLIEVDGLRFLTDPVLDQAGSSSDYGPIHLEKTTAAATSGDQLGRLDAVLLSHDQHGDNLDNAGRALLSQVPRVLTTPLAASRLGGAAEGLSDWQSVSIAGAEGSRTTVMAVPAQHGPDGTQDATGPVTGFLITTSAGKKIYVSGDTILFKGTEEIAARCGPVDVAILHLGRVQVPPLPGATLSMTAEEATRYAKALQARKVVPIHFEGWAHFTEGRDAAMRVFGKDEIMQRTVWLERGESANFE